MKVWDWCRHGLYAAFAGGALLLAGSAQAQQCEADADCPEGFVCEGVAVDGCAVPDIACVGDDCPKRPECDATPRNFCVPAPCSDDSDCPESMVCYTRSYEACSAGGAAPCKPGEECAPAEPMEPTCETMTESMCVPPHVLPCTADADCGPGFRCVEEIARGCRGSSGSGAGGSSGGDEPAPTPPPECFAEPTGNFICELQEVACETDDDCEAGLTCEANPNAPVCSGAGSDDGSDGFAPDRAAGCPTSDVPAHVCLPPNYGGWGRDLGGVQEDGSATPTTGAGAPRTDGDGAPGSSSGEPNAAPGASEDGPKVGSKADGCSTTGATSGSWLTVIGLLLLAGARRRRS